MAVKLWTVHFMRICVANLLLFISLYVLFPVLPIEMSERLGLPVTETGVIFLFFTLGMFLIGPFHAYLVDAYKRKNVCLFSFALMVAATVGYAFVTNITELILLSTVQGLAFGIATTAGITLAIDITNSTLRSAGNVSFSWIARLGMILGIILGVWFDQHYAFKTLLTVSVTTGALGILTVAGVYVPFRAPFVKLSHHCQRGTANTTHLLAGEVGITLGIAVACYMDTDTDQMFYIGQIVASVALLFFVLITYPYYIKKKVR